MTEAVVSQHIKEAQDALGNLLKLRRLCALVHPITHEKGKGRNKRPEPSGSFRVQLFEGGDVVMSTEEANQLVEQVNRVIVVEVRDTLDHTLRTMTKLASSGGVDSMKVIADLLVQVMCANSFALRSMDMGSGQARVFPDHTAYVRFDGPGAESRAEEFCMAVNASLTKHLTDIDQHMSTALKEALNRL